MPFTMTFNGEVLPLKISKVGGRGPLFQEVYRRSRVNADGSYFIKKRFPERPMPVDCALISENIDDMRVLVNRLNEILDVPKPVPIVFSDEPTMTYTGILEGLPDWDEFIYKGKGVLPFMREPHKEGTERTYTVGASAITNGGSKGSNPIFTITFTAPASEFKITHQETGKYVKVVYDFVAGNTLIIDLRKRKVLIDNILQMTAYSLDSQPFEILPGSNTFVITPTSAATTQITFKPKWV